MHTITMPSNGISEVGQEQIQSILYFADLPYLPDTWDWQFHVGGKGEYVGSFTKRVGKWIHQEHKKKLRADTRALIGTAAADHCEKEGNTYHFKFVSKFCWERGEYGDPDSCFWTCNRAAKRFLENSGQFSAMLFYKDEEGKNGIGRSLLWEADNCTLVWNTYWLDNYVGNLSVARLLAHYEDHAYYRRVYMSNKGDRQGTIWINCDAYAVGNQQDVLKLENSFDMKLDTGGMCSDCGSTVRDNRLNEGLNKKLYCIDCYNKHFATCEECSVEVEVGDAKFIDGYHYCQGCFDTNYITCQDCQNPVYVDDVWGDGDDKYCEHCYDKLKEGVE